MWTLEEHYYVNMPSLIFMDKKKKGKWHSAGLEGHPGALL